jgi:hypothetical protein
MSLGESTQGSNSFSQGCYKPGRRSMYEEQSRSMIFTRVEEATKVPAGCLRNIGDSVFTVLLVSNVEGA